MKGMRSSTEKVVVHSRNDQEHESMREFRAWREKYEPIERAILEERERRAASKRCRAIERRKEFGALCEISEGRAAFARRNGMTLGEADRIFRRLRPFHPSLALPCMLLGDAWSAACAMRAVLTKRIDKAKHEAVRPFYYARERVRRQMLAAERRKVRMRHTINPCPTKEQILEAWTKVKESPEALLRFGSMIEDLECYVDNSLRRTEDGVIVGRRPGIKGWLQMELPALYLKYKTVMAYKATAKRMRQVLDIRDPVPLSMALPDSDGVGRRRINHNDAHICGANPQASRNISKSPEENLDYGADEIYEDRSGPAICEMDELDALRARAVYLEVMRPLGNGCRRQKALMRRLNALTDPDAVDATNMLKAWREEYKRKITVRTKSKWEQRLG